MKKLPEDAEKVFSWVVFDTYQWNQELFDGSFTRFEKIVRHASVNIIVAHNEMILVSEEEQPTKGVFPSMPGGGNGTGETPEQSAKRELLEETGYQCAEWEVFREYTGVSSRICYPETVFIAKNPEKTAEPHLDGGEKIRLRWVSFDDFLALCRNPRFSVPLELKFEMYEALLDPIKYEGLRAEILGKI